MGKQKKSHEEFIQKFKEKQPVLFNNIEIISKYEKSNLPILIKDKYGICESYTANLLNGHPSTIQTAVNKHSYFTNQLLEVNPSFFDSREFVSYYIAPKKHILVKDKYGICKVAPDHLLGGRTPTIRSAINPTEYWINMAKEVHGELYDYSLVEYVDAITPVYIMSNYQTFEQTPNSHLQGRGCSILGAQSNYHYTTYVNKGLNSNYYKGFKVYIIKCYNENEVFYKIGRTFKSIKDRYRIDINMPYTYEIVKIFDFKRTFDDGIENCKLEHKLHLDNREFKYKPLIKFPGSAVECFSQVNLNIARELLTN